MTMVEDWCFFCFARARFPETDLFLVARVAVDPGLGFPFPAPFSADETLLDFPLRVRGPADFDLPARVFRWFDRCAEPLPERWVADEGSFIESSPLAPMPCGTSIG